MKVLAWEKRATSLLKTGFLVSLNLKERWRVVELKKYLKTGVKSKLFKKIESSKIIWKLAFWKLAFWKLDLKIGILGIKFERNWNFEKLFKDGILKINK